jgi:hypothetical protein
MPGWSCSIIFLVDEISLFHVDLVHPGEADETAARRGKNRRQQQHGKPREP